MISLVRLTGVAILTIAFTALCAEAGPKSKKKNSFGRKDCLVGVCEGPPVPNIPEPAPAAPTPTADQALKRFNEVKSPKEMPVQFAVVTFSLPVAMAGAAWYLFWGRRRGYDTYNVFRDADLSDTLPPVDSGLGLGGAVLSPITEQDEFKGAFKTKGAISSDVTPQPQPEVPSITETVNAAPLPPRPRRTRTRRATVKTVAAAPENSPTQPAELPSTAEAVAATPTVPRPRRAPVRRARTKPATPPDATPDATTQPVFVVLASDDSDEDVPWKFDESTAADLPPAKQVVTH